MTKNKKLLIGILVVGIVISISLILYSRATCIDSNEQCEGMPDGNPCNFGIWCDSFGRICGGQSCVGLGLGKCFQGKCVYSEMYENLTKPTQ